MIFVDSSVWINYFNGNDTIDTQKLDLLLGNEPICIGDIILTEVLQGFRNDKDYEIAKQLLISLTIFNLGGKNLAIKSADNFRFLRKNGITVRKTIDVLIATFCIENNIILLHSDRDFEPFHLHLNLQKLS